MAKTIAGDIISQGAVVAGGAAAGPIGAAAGAALGKIIGNMFRGSGSSWANAGPGVHDWFTVHGPQAFLDWMRGNQADKFGDLNAVKLLYYLWVRDVWSGANGALRQTADPSFMVDGTWAGNVAAFAKVGIDLEASDAAQKLEGGNDGWRQGSPFGIPHCNYIGKPFIKAMPGPSPVVETMQDAVDKKEAGLPLTKEEKEIVENLNKAAGGSFDIGSIAPLLFLVVILYVILKR